MDDDQIVTEFVEAFIKIQEKLRYLQQPSLKIHFCHKCGFRFIRSTKNYIDRNSLFTSYRCSCGYVSMYKKPLNVKEYFENDIKNGNI